MNCEHCHQVHYGSYGSGRFCSSKCARAFSTTLCRAEINARVSEQMRKRKPITWLTKKCKNCSIEFKVRLKGKHRTCCSGKCLQNLPENRKAASDRMIKRIENGSGWSLGGGRRVEFSFTNHIIQCDSVLEWTALTWFTTTKKVSSIQRSGLRLKISDPETDQVRTFIPDFKIITSEGTFIVECKSRQHPKRDGSTLWKNYQRLVPAKKNALQQYCIENDAHYFWFDELTDKSGYRQALAYFKLLTVA